MSASVHHRPSVRGTALAGILVAALCVFGFAGSGAANATNGDSVATFTALQAELTGGFAPLTLSGNISPGVSDGNGLLKTHADATINLNGHVLNAKGIVIESGTTLTIEDTGHFSGNLDSHGDSNGVPGITVSSGSSLVVDGGDIDADGGPGQPGIGGASGVNDPNLGTALTGVGHIDVEGGSVYAYSGSGGAAIGGDSTQTSGGSVTIGAAGFVDTVTADSGQSAFGGGGGSNAITSLDIAGQLYLASGQKLDVPSDSSATIDSSGSILGRGEVDVEGVLANAGRILVPTVSGEANITGNNALLTFTPGSEPGTQPASPLPVRVFASTFTATGGVAPQFTASGDFVSGWSENAEGTSAWLPSTTLTGDTTVYAIWDPFASVAVTAAKDSAPNGSTIALTLTGTGAASPLDQTGDATFSSSVPADVISGSTVMLHGIGPHVISATVPSYVTGGNIHSTADPTIIGTGPLASAMTISPTKPTVSAGVPTTFTVSGEDADGVSLGDISNEVVWSGFSASKGDTKSANVFSFGTVGTRTLKATIGSHSVSTTVKVVAGSLDHLEFVTPPTTVVAGTTTTFVVDGFDAEGNPLGNETANSTIAVSDLQGGETISGSAVKFEVMNPRTVTATDGSASGTTDLTVVPGVATAFFTSPLDPPPVTAGDTEGYGAGVNDAYGNTIDFVQSRLVLTSSDPSDKISGYHVTFIHAHTHTITMTYQSARISFQQVVDPLTVIPEKMTFDNHPAIAYPHSPFSITASTSDTYGNAVAPLDTAIFSAGDSKTTVTGTGSAAQVTFATLGKHRVSATAAGYVGISETFTVIKDTSTPTFDDSALTASIQHSFTVDVPAGASAVAPTGTVTLHYGSRSAKATLVAGSPSVATFSLPALKPGTDTFSATYGGDSEYSGKTSPKTKISVVAGDADHIRFVSPPTSVVAGASVVFADNEYDFFDNLIGAETPLTTFTLSNENSAGGESVTGNTIRFTEAGTRTVTAATGTHGAETAMTTVVVGPAAVSVLLPPIPTFTVVAGSKIAFSADARDAYGNLIGTLTTALKVHSSNSSDTFSKNRGTFTKAGTRTVTLTDGAVSADVSVTIVPAAATGIVFESSATKAYGTVPFSLQIATGDKYGNPIAEVASSVPNPPFYASTGSATTDVFINQDAATVTFQKLGNHTVSATYDGVKISKTVDVIRDTAVISFPPDGVVVGGPLNVMVSPGPSGILPTGIVTLHYGSHTITAPLVHDDGADYSYQSLTMPTAGTYVVYITYPGSNAYVSGMSIKRTIIVTP
jgi:hypothetical protein